MVVGPRPTQESVFFNAVALVLLLGAAWARWLFDDTPLAFTRVLLSVGGFSVFCYSRSLTRGVNRDVDLRQIEASGVKIRGLLAAGFLVLAIFCGFSVSLFFIPRSTANLPIFVLLTVAALASGAVLMVLANKCWARIPPN